MSILTIALGAVVCGAETWDDIAAFGEAKVDWLTSFLDLPHGIPSHDTFNRVFAALDPKQFQTCFVTWMKAVATVLPMQVIALDGKTVCGSHDRANGKAAIHLVSAWASANHLVLAQVKVDAKSNEITAIPDLLRVLAVEGCIVTIDAMGCQRDIAQQIIDQGGDYVLALKENQETLYRDVVEMFAHAQAQTIDELVVDDSRSVNKGHGRIEVRRFQVIPDADVLAWLQDGHHWPGLEAIGMVEAERRIGETRTTESRYYLLSAPLKASVFGDAVRRPAPPRSQHSPTPPDQAAQYQGEAAQSRMGQRLPPLKYCKEFRCVGPVVPPSIGLGPTTTCWPAGWSAGQVSANETDARWRHAESIRDHRPGYPALGHFPDSAVSGRKVCRDAGRDHRLAHGLMGNAELGSLLAQAGRSARTRGELRRVHANLGAGLSARYNRCVVVVVVVVAESVATFRLDLAHCEDDDMGGDAIPGRRAANLS